MIGVLLLSHGEMASGMYNSLGLFFGEEIPQLKAECFKMGDSEDEFEERIRNAVKELDDGHGVVICCDLFGGTPNNKCAFLVHESPESVHVISGVNLGIVIELLSKRMWSEDISELDLDYIIESGKNSVVYLNQALKKALERD